jgi:hypothetical protein
MQKDQWAQTDLDFARLSRRSDGREGKPRKGDQVDEVQFLVPERAELQVDDVLLYEPADVPKQ